MTLLEEVISRIADHGKKVNKLISRAYCSSLPTHWRDLKIIIITEAEANENNMQSERVHSKADPFKTSGGS
jgi:hypothetical protein